MRRWRGLLACGSMRALRLMTYNVRYFAHGSRGVVSTRGGLARIANSVAALMPLADVVCLQEVEHRSLRSSLVTRGGKSQLDVFMRALEHELAARTAARPESGRPGDRYEAHYFPAHSYPIARGMNLYTTGLAILVRSRLEVIEHDAVRVHDITHRRGAKALKQTRILAHVTVRPRGASGAAARCEELDVFNTHMSLPGPFYREFWTSDARLGFGPNQLAESERMLAAVRTARRADRMVLVGDFNSLPGSPVDRHLREEGGLVDALAENHGLCDLRRRAFATAGFMHARMALDRIYASPELRWLDFDGSAPFDGSTFAGLSDHVPVLGRLTLGA